MKKTYLKNFDWNKKTALALAVGLVCLAILMTIREGWSTATPNASLGKEISEPNEAVEGFASPIEANPDFSAGISGVILPHHLLVQGFLNSFYAKIADKNQYDLIILISPNHFGYGMNYIRTSNKIEGHSLNFDEQAITELTGSGAAFLEPKYFEREHGIWTQENYLKKYFPSAKVLPVIIKDQTPQEKLDKLVGQINSMIKEKEAAGERVVVMASLDFSHYSSEKSSLENDIKTVNWLKKLANKPEKEIFTEAIDLGKSADQRIRGAVGIDSPWSFYTFAEIMRNRNTTDFHLWKRTSTIALIPGTLDENNTSHLFGILK